MSSKKSAKGAKKKVDAVGDKDKESLKLAQSEIAHLQQHIELQKHDMVEARRMERLWRQVCLEQLMILPANATESCEDTPSYWPPGRWSHLPPHAAL